MGFDLNSVKATDTFDYEVKHPLTGEPTGWTITLAGPTHHQSITLFNAAMRASLHEERQKKQAYANGKKWIEPEETPEELRRRTMQSLVGRIVGWAGLQVEGAPFPFSPSTALDLFLRHDSGWVTQQLIEALGSDANFFAKGARPSSPGQPTSSS